MAPPGVRESFFFVDGESPASLLWDFLSRVAVLSALGGRPRRGLGSSTAFSGSLPLVAPSRTAAKSTTLPAEAGASMPGIVVCLSFGKGLSGGSFSLGELSFPAVGRSLFGVSFPAGAGCSVAGPEIPLSSGCFSTAGGDTVLGVTSATGASFFAGAGCPRTGGSALMGSVFPALGGSFTFPELGIWLLSGNQKPPFREIEKASLPAGRWATIASLQVFVYENAVRSPVGRRLFTLNVRFCATIKGVIIINGVKYIYWQSNSLFLIFL